MVFRLRVQLALATVFALGCAGSTAARPPAATDGAEAEPAARAQAPAAEPEPPSTSDEGGTIPYWRDGEKVGMVTREGAARRGLTVIDLGDEWAPHVFTEDESLGASGRQPYRPELIALSNDPDEYLELYGIFPSFHVLAQRIGDEERHRCHDGVDDAPIEAIDDSVLPRRASRAQRRTVNRIRAIRRKLEREARRRDLSSIEELADHRRFGRELTRIQELEGELSGVHAVQAHLSCDGLLHSRGQEGVLDAWSAQAIRAFQAKHMIISLGSRLDEATRAAMVMDSRELDFHSLLRALRERVASAGGILEDGTASGQWGTVVDRQIDLDDEFRWASRLDPLPNGAPDRVSEATDAAARALGWTDPAAAEAWLAAHVTEREPHRFVAIELPPRPDYYAPHMDLRVEIDRGDVWYAFPYTDDGRRRGFRVRQRPLLMMYVRHEGADIPLVRWNTTIGSWQPEINPEGGVGMRYKESDVGPRVWRDVIAGPAWLPPASTPDDELLQRRRGGWRVKRSITGPGYDSAFGLAMVIHHQVRGDGSEESDWIDNGIRSHGSVSYRTILRGYSHGCHRLFNHLAVRMTSFVVGHREHVVHGRIPASFRRELRPEPEELTPEQIAAGEQPREVEPLVLEIDTRGYRFELTPPVPVEVLEGNVRGRPRRAPTGFFPLPSELQEQAREELASDPSTSGAATPASPTPTSTPAPVSTPAP